MSEIANHKILESSLRNRIDPRCIGCRPLNMAVIQIAEVAVSTGFNSDEALESFDRIKDPNCEGPKLVGEETPCSTPDCGHSKGALFLIKKTREIYSQKNIFPTAE